MVVHALTAVVLYCLHAVVEVCTRCRICRMNQSTKLCIIVFTSLTIILHTAEANSFVDICTSESGNKGHHIA